MINHPRYRLKLRARAQQVAGRLRRQTSVSDTPAYTKLCAAAASEPDVFATFKRHPAYRKVLEHVSCEHGAEYLEIALDQTPAIADRLDSFRLNDKLGSPHECSYGSYGDFSPTTLRYVKVLSDLQAMFGPLAGMRIVEVGVGYGGQCFVTYTGGGYSSYTLVDLPPVLRLATRYLEALGVPDVELEPHGKFDLVVSNYAFSECTRRVQERYLTRLLMPTPRGYLTCNFRDGLGRDELADRVPGSRWMAERPLTAKKNAILVWGDA